MNSWMTADLADLIQTIQSGGRPKGGVSETSGEIPSLGGENIRQNGGLDLASVNRIPRKFFNRLSKGILKPLDVLINKDGANTGKVGLYEGQYSEAAINEHVFLLRGESEKLDQKFLYYLLLSQYGQLPIKSKISGSAQPGLKGDFIRDFPVRIPQQTKVQVKIADILVIVDQVINQTEEVIQKHQRIKTGLVQNLLTCGIDEHGCIRNSKTHVFKPSPLGLIPNDWECIPSEKLCPEICVGIVIKPSQYYRERGVPALRSANIREQGIDTSEMVFISETANRMLKKSLLRKGYVVSVRTGYPGTSAVIPEELDGVNCIDLVISKPGPEILSNYLALWINSPYGRGQVLRGQGGLAQQHFNVSEMKNLLVLCPKPHEQQRILDVLNTQTKMLSGESCRLDKLKKIKKGLMQDLLTGKVLVQSLVEMEMTGST